MNNSIINYSKNDYEDNIKSKKLTQAQIRLDWIPLKTRQEVILPIVLAQRSNLIWKFRRLAPAIAKLIDLRYKRFM